MKAHSRQNWSWCHSFCFVFFFNIYLFGCVRSSLRHAGSSSIAWGLSSCSLELRSCSMWDLSFPIRNRTCIPCVGRWILNHWTTREILALFWHLPASLSVSFHLFLCLPFFWLSVFMYWFFFSHLGKPLDRPLMEAVFSRGKVQECCSKELSFNPGSPFCILQKGTQTETAEPQIAHN